MTMTTYACSIQTSQTLLTTRTNAISSCGFQTNCSLPIDQAARPRGNTLRYTSHGSILATQNTHAKHRSPRATGTIADGVAILLLKQGEKKMSACLAAILVHLSSLVILERVLAQNKPSRPPIVDYVALRVGKKNRCS